MASTSSFVQDLEVTRNDFGLKSFKMGATTPLSIFGVYQQDIKISLPQISVEAKIYAKGEECYTVATEDSKIMGSGSSPQSAIQDWVQRNQQRSLPSGTKPKRYPKSLLRRMACETPGELVKLIELRSFNDVDLSFAAEALGGSDSFVTSTLKQLLLHPEPIVREGAVYGLAGHLEPSIYSILTRVASSDPSPSVRAAAAEVID